MIKHRIEVFEGRNGFYWRARHLKTDKIIADGSEGYSTRSNARRAAKRIGLVLMVAPVVNVEKKYG
jgi:uncharacterized protein YegP (UPF0339 family)